MSTRKADHTMRSVIKKSLVAILAIGLAIIVLFGIGADPASASRPKVTVESVCVDGVVTSDILSIRPDSFTDQTVTISVDGVVKHTAVLPANGPFYVTVPHADSHNVGVEYVLWSGVSWYPVTVSAIECEAEVTEEPVILLDLEVAEPTPAATPAPEITGDTTAPPTTIVVTTETTAAEITGTFELPATGFPVLPVILGATLLLFLGSLLLVSRSEKARRWIDSIGQ